MRPVSLALSVIKNRLGRVPRPSWCTYLVCYRCNARCQMCDSWRVRPGTELTPEQVATVFGKIGRLDVVRLSGGEPFLREDMLEIAEAVNARSRPFVLHITTNGSFPDRIEDFIRRFSHPSKLRFMVSFDGLQEEHDRNRGKEVLFETALESVRRIASFKHTHGVEVSANHTVITPKSMADNAGLRKLLGEHGCDVHSVLAYADSAMYGAKLRGTKAEHLIVPDGYPLHPALNGADVVGFVDEEIRRLGEFDSVMMRVGKRYYLSGLKARLRTADGRKIAAESSAAHSGNGHANGHPKPQPKCVALRSHIRILPDGGVPVCQFNTEKAGNLLTQSFEEVWFGEETKQHRQWVDDCPGCWAECEVMPNALYSGDLLSPVNLVRRPGP